MEAACNVLELTFELISLKLIVSKIYSVNDRLDCQHDTDHQSLCIALTLLCKWNKARECASKNLNILSDFPVIISSMHITLPLPLVLSAIATLCVSLFAHILSFSFNLYATSSMRQGILNNNSLMGPGSSFIINPNSGLYTRAGFSCPRQDG